MVLSWFFFSLFLHGEKYVIIHLETDTNEEYQFLKLSVEILSVKKESKQYLCNNGFVSHYNYTFVTAEIVRRV